MPVRVILRILKRLYTVQCTISVIFQMVEDNILCHAKLLRDDIKNWEVMSKYEDVVLLSQGGHWPVGFPIL